MKLKEIEKNQFFIYLKNPFIVGNSYNIRVQHLETEQYANFWKNLVKLLYRNRVILRPTHLRVSSRKFSLWHLSKAYKNRAIRKFSKKNLVKFLYGNRFILKSADLRVSGEIRVQYLGKKYKILQKYW